MCACCVVAWTDQSICVAVQSLDFDSRVKLHINQFIIKIDHGKKNTQLAKVRQSVLIISTDPAHNLRYIYKHRYAYIIRCVWFRRGIDVFMGVDPPM